MQKLTKRLAPIGLIAILAGCNTTDALTPQVDVGGGEGAVASAPVTQSDLDGMADARAPATASQQNAFTPAAETPASSGGTLEAQADALARREAPAARTTATETATAPVAAASAGETIRFLPIIGAPVQAVTPLSKRLGAEARAGGLVIKSASDGSASHILKGYLSAMKEGGKTTVTYVWDVLDGQGARLHRIQGQESVSATAADPWAAVPASTMEGIAARTIRDYLAWRGGSARG